MTTPNQPTDEEIQAELDKFLEKLPDAVPTCLHVHADWLSVEMGQSIEDGTAMVVVEIQSPITEERAESARIFLAFDEVSLAKMIVLAHEAGTTLWGDDEEDDDDWIG